MLNYAYAVLESQVQIATVAQGLDPTIGGHKKLGRDIAPQPSCDSLDFSYSDSTLTTSLGSVTLMLTMVSPSATSS
jgi:hypothetical protein